MKYFQFYFQALDIPELDDMEQPTKPDPDKYFFERPSSEKKLPKLPALADSKYCTARQCSPVRQKFMETVLYNQSNSVAFDETSSNWTALKSS